MQKELGAKKLDGFMWWLQNLEGDINEEVKVSVVVIDRNTKDELFDL